MSYNIPILDFPEEVSLSSQLTPEEKTKPLDEVLDNHKVVVVDKGEAFHEKLPKNSKVNQGGKYKRELAAKYKKPQRRGDKIQNMNKKKRK